MQKRVEDARYEEQILPWAQFQPKKPKRVEFCIYTPGESDYWGEFATRKEMFAYLKEHFPGFVYDSKNSNDQYARYNCGSVLIVTTGM